MSLIYHTVTGSGQPPMVFVHGFACTHTDWQAQVAHFAPRHQCIAVDLRGHGASAGDAADCSIERYGADVAEVMRALSLPPAVLVGHSLGCRVVIEAALQAPEHVSGVVLVDGSQFAPAVGVAMQEQFAKPGGYAAMTDALFISMFTEKSDRALVAAVVDRARSLPEAVGQKMLPDLVRYDVGRLAKSLSGLRVPVMALQATYTNERRERVSLLPGQTTPYLDMLRANLPSVQIEIIPETGHFPQLDEAARTNAALARFVSALPVK